MTKTLKYCPHGNARVRVYTNTAYQKDTVILQSYETDVAIISPISDNCVRLEILGLFSMTTRKHISFFVREYLPTVSYSDCKKAYFDNADIYVNTDNGSVYFFDKKTGVLYEDI